MNLKQLIEDSDKREGRAVKDDAVQSNAIYCVIMDMNPIKKSKGTDYYRQFFVLDESIDGAWRSLEKIEVMLFSREEYSLPGYIHHIQRGDVLRMEGIDVGTYLQRPQLKGKIGRGSSFRYQIYTVDEGEDMPYDLHEASSVPMGEADRARLREMRRYSVERQAHIAMVIERERQQLQGATGQAAVGARAAPTANTFSTHQIESTKKSKPAAISSLRSFQPSLMEPLPTPIRASMSHGGPVMIKKVSEVISKAVISRKIVGSIDFVAKVVTVDNRDPGFVVAFLWDGDDVPPLSPTTTILPVLDPSLLSPVGSSFDWSRSRRQVQVVDGACLSSLHVLSDEPHVLLNAPSLPTTGTFVPLLIPNSIAREADGQVNVDTWYKFKNLVPVIVRGQLQLLFVTKSRRTERRDSENMRENKRRGGSPATNLYAPNKLELLQSVVADCDPDMEPITVRALLSAVVQGMSGIYRIHARITRSYPSPSQVEKALIPLDLLCLPESEITPQARACGHSFALKVLLEDATGEIDAILLGEDGETFFSQLVPPFNPKKKTRRSNDSSAAVLKLQQWLDWLMSSSLIDESDAVRESGTLMIPERYKWLDVCVKVSSLGQDDPQGLMWAHPPVRIVQTTLKAPR